MNKEISNNFLSLDIPKGIKPIKPTKEYLTSFLLLNNNEKNSKKMPNKINKKPVKNSLLLIILYYCNG